MDFKSKTRTRKLITGSALTVGFIMILIFSVAASMLSAWVWGKLNLLGIG